MEAVVVLTDSVLASADENQRRLFHSEVELRAQIVSSLVTSHSHPSILNHLRESIHSIIILGFFQLLSGIIEI
ncbi:hypothetical protein AFUB_001910 [Aspergillus fumigatus A1163]|uniref:Uncharacterized protein n=1 Tax=Aspergillus fumigatus (strain CBS 144.89 / FGSC A1163 / CEA10) TaxID=451804 RepID=B0XR48_ASPFC|nr:hypothetical protein AFUB_001910 [Aspergillus fumigatus A1163]